MRHSWMRQPHGLVLGAVSVVGLVGCFSCGAGGKATGQGDAGQLGFSRCIEDWPSANGPHPTKPSLNVEAPKVVWRTEVPWAQSRTGLEGAGPVLSRNRLAFRAWDYVYFLDKDGSNPQKVKHNNVGELPSGLVADEAGNLYYVAQDGVYSIDATGELRWHGEFGRSATSGEGEFIDYWPPVLGPNGVVYAVTSAQRVFAVRTSDGGLLWSQPAPGNANPSRVMGGGGNVVFVAINGEHTDALETQTGRTLGSFVRPAYGKSFTWSWGTWVLGWDFGIAYCNVYVFDTCGKLKWSKSPQGETGVVSANELMVVSPQGASLALFNSVGEMVAGPTPARGRPIGAGADGTFYTVDGTKIFAYSSDLTGLWNLDIGTGGELTGGVVLDDDGMMYLVRAANSATEVVGIQTRSPGLADSSWPSLRHDNRGTAWLVPGVPSTGAPTQETAATP